MKRILIISFYHPPDITPGAFRIKSIIDEISKSKEKDILVDVITTEPNRYTSYNNKKLDNESSDLNSTFVNIHKIKIPQNYNKLSLQILGFIIFAIHVLKFCFKKDWDILFATSSRLMTAFLSAIIAHYKNIHLFLDIRDLFSDTAKDVFTGNFFKLIFPLIKFIESWTFKKASIINIVSPGFLNFVKEINPNARILNFTNGIDDIFLNYDFNRSFSKNKKLRILYAGNIGSGQALETILPNFAKEKQDQCELTVIGNGGTKHLLEKQIRMLDCKNINITDHISRSDLLKEYSKTDIFFLHLADLDCFHKVLPSKIFEYASTGKPILAGVSGAAKDFLEQNVPWAFIFPPSDVLLCNKSFESIASDYKVVNTDKFNQNFSRKKISSLLVKQILDYKS